MAISQIYKKKCSPKALKYFDYFHEILLCIINYKLYKLYWTIHIILSDSERERERKNNLCVNCNT